LSRDETVWLLNGSGRVSEAELMTTATGSIAAAKRVLQDRVGVDVIFEETSKEALSGAPTAIKAERMKPSLQEPLHSIVMKPKNRPRKPSSELTLESEESKFHEVMAKAGKIAEEEADQDRIMDSVRRTRKASTDIRLFKTIMPPLTGSSRRERTSRSFKASSSVVNKASGAEAAESKASCTQKSPMQAPHAH